MEILNIICNTIVLISGTLIGIKTISEMIGKPIRLMKNKSTEEFEQKVLDILEKTLPKDLHEHDLETRDKYRADRQRYLEDIKEEVLADMVDQLTIIDELQDQIGHLQEDIKKLSQAQKDVLREKIVCLYENNKDHRRLKYFERQALDQYYTDYKSMNGNSYIELLYARMITWEVAPDDYE